MALGLLGGALATAVIEKVVAVASNHTGGYFIRRKGMEEELQRLTMLLPQIQSVIDAAERGEQQISDPLREWLRQLKHAVYEADDVLDELDYLKLKADVNKKEQHKVHELISKGKAIFKPDPTLKKLRRVAKKLGEVAANVGNFTMLVSKAQREFQQQETQTICDRETGLLLTENKVLGREEERDELLRWLTMMPADHENVSLFSVVGHGGMGKTTLARLVFKDDIVLKSFDLKIWVCVSTSFDVKVLTRSILKSAKKQRPDVDGLPSLEDSLAELQDALKKKLETSGKFLLILDDVWNDDNRSKWNELLAPLEYGHKGSKILLTTRTDRVADMAARAMSVSTKGSLKLGGLRDEDFSSLFNRYAFAGVKYESYPYLQYIGKQIANRLGSSPLAATTVGGLLNSNLDDRYWNKILHSKNILDQEQHGKGDIMSILMLSYHHLHLHLRPCFVYCAMFPKDHKLRKDDLVLMWMAVGLIRHSHQNQVEMLEDIGGRYFDELVRRSLLDHDELDDSYTMHDLLHDLAQSVSHGECSSFDDNDEEVEDIIPKVAQPEHFSALEEVLRSLKSIRMLHVNLGYKEVTMPDAFDHLIHLRSLIIKGRKLRQFPISICKLYHLHDLKFNYSLTTFKLPESMNKLVKLRRLSASDQVAGVRKLSCLQELDFSIRKERGYKIGELGDLIWLRTLTVKGLENVGNQGEASTAKLGDKNYLQNLHLVWGGSSDPEMDKHELVLDRLQPHANLMKLTFEGYRGIRYANWLEFQLRNNLRHICLSNCSRLDHLPSLERLPYLEGFELKNMPAMKKLDFQFQHLKYLSIDGMEGLEELSGPGEDAGQWHPRLHNLRIKNCPKLEVIPFLSLSIREIKLHNLGLVSLPTLWLDRSNTCSTSGSSSSSLQEMKITNCGKITSLGEGLLQQQHYLTALVRLKIKNCPELVDFPSGGLQHLRALNELRIVNCPKLRLALDTITPSDGNDDTFLPSSLRELYIRGDCGELVRSITTLLKGIVSLDTLRLEEFLPKLVHAEGSDFTVAVERLVIDDTLLLAAGALLRNITPVQKLSICNYGQLESIDGELEQWFLKNQTTLKSMVIWKAPSLKSLPGCLKNLSSLKYLTIFMANGTLIERCRKYEGADWPTIRHIPNISIK